MTGIVLAAALAVPPMHTPQGYILTFLFPMLLAIGIFVYLYVVFTAPHQVPGHPRPTADRSTIATPTVEGKE